MMSLTGVWKVEDSRTDWGRTSKVEKDEAVLASAGGIMRWRRRVACFVRQVQPPGSCREEWRLLRQKGTCTASRIKDRKGLLPHYKCRQEIIVQRVSGCALEFIRYPTGQVTLLVRWVVGRGRWGATPKCKARPAVASDLEATICLRTLNVNKNECRHCKDIDCQRTIAIHNKSLVVIE